MGTYADINRIVDFNSAANWVKRVDKAQDHVNTYVRGYYKRIAFDRFDYVFSSPIIAVNVFSNDAQDYWKNAGYLRQIASTELFGDGVTGDGLLISIRHRIPLAQPIAILFPLNLPFYYLKYDPPYYFPDATIKIWEYVGSDVDVQLNEINKANNKLDEIKTHLGM